MKSFDRSPILEQRETKYKFNDKYNIEENKDKNDNNEVPIKVKREPNITRRYELSKKEGKYESKYDNRNNDKEKDKNNNKVYLYQENNNKIFNSDNKNKNNNINEYDENNGDRDREIDDSKRIPKVNSKIRLTKKKI